METNAHTNSPNTSAVSKTAARAHSVVDDVVDAAEQAVRDTKPVVERVSKSAHQVVDKAADMAAPAADWLVDKGQSLRAAPKKLLDGSCQYVAANPLKSVGIALLAGFLISRIRR